MPVGCVITAPVEVVVGTLRPTDPSMEGVLVGRLLCLLRRHSWGPFTSDEAGPYRTCTRCGKFWNSHRLGPDGYDRMPPTPPGGSGVM
jgi:hypothetical protein